MHSTLEQRMARRAERICDLCSAPAPWQKYTLQRIESGFGAPTILRFCSPGCLERWVQEESEGEETEFMSDHMVGGSI